MPAVQVRAADLHLTACAPTPIARSPSPASPLVLAGCTGAARRGLRKPAADSTFDSRSRAAIGIGRRRATRGAALPAPFACEASCSAVSAVLCRQAPPKQVAASRCLKRSLHVITLPWRARWCLSATQNSRCTCGGGRHERGSEEASRRSRIFCVGPGRQPAERHRLWRSPASRLDYVSKHQMPGSGVGQCLQFSTGVQCRTAQLCAASGRATK